MCMHAAVLHGLQVAGGCAAFSALACTMLDGFCWNACHCHSVLVGLQVAEELRLTRRLAGR